MPTASDDLRNQVRAIWGEIDLIGPLEYLKAKGFKDVDGVLVPPLPNHELSQIEGLCVDFLCDEWDFGYRPLFPNGERNHASK